MQPGAQVRALLEGPEARERFREHLLHEILRVRGVPGQPQRGGAQLRLVGQHLVGEPVRWLGGITHL